MIPCLWARVLKDLRTDKDKFLRLFVNFGTFSLLFLPDTGGHQDESTAGATNWLDEDIVFLAQMVVNTYLPR
jgi:hypothetical protein